MRRFLRLSVFGLAIVALSTLASQLPPMGDSSDRLAGDPLDAGLAAPDVTAVRIARLNLPQELLERIGGDQVKRAYTLSPSSRPMTCSGSAPASGPEPANVNLPPGVMDQIGQLISASKQVSE